MARHNRPSMIVYGGTIRAGCRNGQKIDVVSAFQAYGEYLSKNITDEERKDILRKACPGAGACGGMYTANTMATAIEVLGLSLPYSSSYPAESKEKIQECHLAGKTIRNLLEKDIKPKDILTRASFENAIAVIMALGGSTNAVLHLIAVAVYFNFKLISVILVPL
jgi:dihydroxy-acid dehydratase